MTDQNNSAAEFQTTIEAAIGYILRPLVRLMLMNGISFQAFCNLAKAAYVNVAENEFKLDAKPQTDSRISLLTGIQRREVSRLRNAQAEEINLSQHASMSALLLTIWSGNEEYLDAQGLPVSLPRLAAQGNALSFESLVQSLSKDFRPRVVLDEWLRQGIVTLDNEDKVHLVADAFAQPQGQEEKHFYLAQNVHDHLAATVHNLAGNQPPFMERCVYYDKLSAESTNQLAQYTASVGMRALHSVNKRAAELQKRDLGKPDAQHRMNFGVYHYSEAEVENGIK